MLAPHPSSVIKTAAEIACIRQACDAAARVLREALAACRPGVTTRDIERAARRAIEQSGAEPIFLGLTQRDSAPFPACACVSINEEVAHGVPSSRVVARGDLVKIDLGLRLEGWCADIASTTVAGLEEPRNPRRRAIDSSRDLIRLAISRILPGTRWSSIALELEQRAAALGYAIVAELVGHGIGRTPHEPPAVPTYWTGFTGDDFTLEPGMVLAIEPVLCFPREGPAPASEAVRRAPVHLAANGWTCRTSDASLAVHEERMVLITPSGAEALAPIDPLDPVS